MLHIRLRRIGKKKQPTYRLIVCEKAKDPYGDYLENLGTYNPRTTPSEINLKVDRIKDWISKGAQCSNTVWNMLIDQGVVTGEKRKSIEISKKRKEKLEKKSADKAAAEETKKAEQESAKQAPAEPEAEAAPEPSESTEEQPTEEPSAEEKKDEPAPAPAEPAEEPPTATEEEPKQE